MTSIAMSLTTTRPLHQRLASVLALLGRFPHSLQQLLFRLAVGSVFLKAGLTKIASWETTVALFRDEYKVPVVPPEMAAALGTPFERGCRFVARGVAAGPHRRARRGRGPRGPARGCRAVAGGRVARGRPGARLLVAGLAVRPARAFFPSLLIALDEEVGAAILRRA